VDETKAEHLQGEVPEGLGPEVFREQLRAAAGRDAADGAHITLGEQSVFLEDVHTVEAEPGGHRSRVHLHNGVIIGGLTGAAIVAALAGIRFRRHHGH
jgi:hypothetical protein